MTRHDKPDVGAWINRTVTDSTGTEIGTVTDVHVDTTKQPDWLAVSTGMFGTRVSFVPVDGARLDGENVMIAYAKQTITDAPRVEPVGAHSVDDERRLCQYYETVRGDADGSTGRLRGKGRHPATISATPNHNERQPR